MYTTVDIKDLSEKYKDFKLCYVDTISRTIYDYDEKAKKIINSPGFSWDNYRDDWRSSHPVLRMCDQPNPEYVPGEKEMYAYFTKIDLSEQWGDDWDDSPYEHNAGEPYDHDWDENHNMIDIEILIVPFVIKSYDFYLPSDWGYSGNSPFCVKDINDGAVAWIYDTTGGKTNSKSVAIHAGVNPLEFVEKLNKIAENHHGWEPRDKEDY